MYDFNAQGEHYRVKHAGKWGFVFVVLSQTPAQFVSHSCQTMKTIDLFPTVFLGVLTPHSSAILTK